MLVYVALAVVALGAGLLVARLLGTSTTVLSGSLTPTPTLQQAAISPSPAPLSAAAPSPAAGSPAAPSATPAPALATEAPPAVATPAPTGLPYVEYTVRRGDTLKQIAQEYDVTLAQILELNEIPNPDSLEIASVLRIPKQ